ncbi:MAG: hypothetical protein LC624_08535 [Halobacteriales archaeon]|nr:hypothetical protein [Halobacteriales archaeon]
MLYLPAGAAWLAMFGSRSPLITVVTWPVQMWLPAYCSALGLACAAK